MGSDYKYMFGIVGAGAWGTALSIAMHNTGHGSTVLWAYEQETAENIHSLRENKAFLPNVRIPDTVHAVSSFEPLSAAKIIFLVVPAQHVRNICQELAPYIRPNAPVIIASKGIELTTNKLMSEVAAEILPENPIYILSGPSFASEVARAAPSALTLASEHDAETIASIISSPTFRIYTTDDIIGAQIGGAVKNVLAIACGIVAGRRFGENARAALITRGLAEINRLGNALGARVETLMGLSGIGDIVLTCSSTQSRNMSLGFALGSGKSLKEILASGNHVTEGIATSKSALGLARRHGIEMPVVNAVDMILRHEVSIDDCINSLLSRPLKNETV
ncbi:MAG: NAD(P)-dependent glycerol-3-phosphate dehydrogenase [Alphaproteobacteria bacterium]|nr:NAD(P)-dependent glycerol-3-phosphate dehydrogenase [Alphaproteobacteria bacterium]MCL2504905.1 NAD(P)-dependent glycerol-3-phosphate dehydrogenase [Alphaproteobacteria bacterium]